MKHPTSTTLLLIGLFFVAQIMGILILTQYIDFEQSAQDQKTSLVTDSYYIQPPEVDNETFTFIPIIFAIVVATILLLFLIKWGKLIIWKIWFTLSVIASLSFAFYPFIAKVIPRDLVIYATFIVAGLLAIWKIFHPNPYVHNITEIFIYGGIAAIVVPLLNIYSAFLLLVLIAAYDYYMVFISKHMVTLAQSSMDSQLIAGLWVKSQIGHRHVNKIEEPVKKRGRPKVIPDPIPHKPYQTAGHAMVGGGDVAFPLLFAGALMKFTGLYMSGFIVAICATLGIAALLIFAKKDKFYPAMPPIAIGCFIGLAIVLLL